MATTIAANAWVDPRAQLDEDVVIGPFSMIGPAVRIGRGTRLHSHVTLMGDVTLGCDNVLFPNVVIGAEPQDVSYAGGDTRVEIGDANTFREGVTVNRASEKEAGVTRIGSHNFLMANSHVAHDCLLGNHILVANGSLLAGHVHVHDYAALSGGCGVHQFVTIGSYSFLGSLSRAIHDIPPFMLCEGLPAHPRCINIVALKRHGFTKDRVDVIAAAHRLLYRSKVGLSHAREILEANNQLTADVQALLGFVDEQHQGRHGRGREARRAA